MLAASMISEQAVVVRSNNSSKPTPLRGAV